MSEYSSTTNDAVLYLLYLYNEKEKEKEKQKYKTLLLLLLQVYIFLEWKTQGCMPANRPPSVESNN